MKVKHPCILGRAEKWVRNDRHGMAEPTDQGEHQPDDSPRAGNHAGQDLVIESLGQLTGEGSFV